ncbi:zinc-binding alcohol dehydrogenase family protein [Sphingomonas sp. HT-1]|uniref:zinc-binding alcohol dehydrogenase family protein n=1 Tax=unclassified Sphingomonas TaxID=196159 RepID=UPI0002D5A15B|nr:MULTISPECIES: zinc-binding alcohol dehydrogenase family protein [unclassified Sphingomonas]KTF67977.1 dehydrogenase [Sphingomonas sp. WG]
MRAIICQEPFRLAEVQREAPSPGPGEVLIRVRRVGLCGTDYHIFSGRHPFLSYPRVMGHELGGEIVALGEGTGLAIGSVVAINPYLACGHCIACRKGRPNACVNINVLGVHSDGGMCDLLVVPERAVIDAAGLTLDQAAMVEFLAIGAHAISRAPRNGEGRMLVVGAGPIGIASALFGRLDGFEVILVDQRAPRLAFARDKLGFDGLVADDSLAGVLAERTHGDMFDVVVDASGSLAAMRRSLDFVGHGGALVLVGVAPGELSFADPEFHKRETVMLASRNALASDFQRVIAAMRSGDIPTDILHTHSLAIETVPQRIPELIAEADTVLKAIVEL